uniref:Neur_chan_LBD domain-containing protein n=1 Tax=Globodera pallida TaxID=36090 RepID=A0A183C9T1_GLOPA
MFGCIEFFRLFLIFGLFVHQIIMANENMVPLTNEYIALLDDEKRYNKYATPTQDKGTATNVSMSMYIEGISSFSAQTMDYHLDMYMYQEWDDVRLRHNGTGPLLIRDKHVFKKLWHPDIYFANAKQASFQEITDDNFMIWIYPNGRVWYDCRISLVAICMMDLWKYPLDSQIYAYPETHLRLRWSTRINPPIDRNMDIKMPDMNLIRIDTGECNGTYVEGIWSCMTAVFYVERAMLHHIIQTYLPTALIVIISWFNFWLDIDSAPARVSLSITTLLTIATQANAVKLALPEVSYIKAIDSWMNMCMVFVFAVMVEYTIAHFAKNQEHLFQFPHHQKVQPPLVVDSDTLNSLFGAGGAPSTPNSNDPADDAAAVQLDLEQFLTPEQLHRNWRKRGCGVLANGRLMSERDSFRHRTVMNPTRPSMKSEVCSSTTEEERRKMSRNFLSADFFHTDEARIKPVSRSSLPGPFQYSDEEHIRVHAVQRKNSIRESARVIRNQVSKQAVLIKRTLAQLRGREMANKIDQKSPGSRADFFRSPESRPIYWPP